ncbi:MAG: hypothetical protein HYY06_32795 [Deltaproteobacteria bacterium]|nr:hypothetical protein [Deltaproteobacteria bacterium]
MLDRSQMTVRQAPRLRRPTSLAALLCFLASGCGGGASRSDDDGDEDAAVGVDGGPSNGHDSGPASDGGGGGDDGGRDGVDAGPTAGVVHVVLFTHIEDNMPDGALGSPTNCEAYDRLSGKLIEMAGAALDHELQWVLQSDWKLLESARLCDDGANTDGKNLFLYLRGDLSVILDPHSHENGGYNYTDVAYLHELLGVGGSTVIGGHIWDPSLPQFQEWDRFREPVAGLMYPEASWRGDILIGAGTPQHVNDPLVSGAWRPRDRDDFFTDDPAGNVVAFGQWHDDVAGVEELVELYADGTVPPDALLTASWNIAPAMIVGPGGLAAVEQSMLAPMAELRDQGLVVVTDFTSLADTWRSDYGGEAFLYQRE